MLPAVSAALPQVAGGNPGLALPLYGVQSAATGRWRMPSLALPLEDARSNDDMPKWSHAYSRPVRPPPDPIPELKRQAAGELAPCAMTAS